jgi:osmotically-inducible protein OsmY
MDDLSRSAARASPPGDFALNPLPETLAEAEKLAASIERAVWHETLGGVRDLHVKVSHQEVVLSGRCRTYYTKQKAQHAAMAIRSTGQLTNQIEVT